MKKYIFVLALVLFLSNANAQTKSIRIGYIDMEYILEKVPDYASAKNQLEEKAQKWKQEMDVKNASITKLKEALKIEKVLLTKELIEEREDEIIFQEKDLSDYQQKKFGPTGDLVTQKTVLVKPIQDAVFNIVQDIATAKKYDFVFDKSSDLTLLFAEKRYDISDQVIRKLTQLDRREQLSKKQLKEEDLKERKQDLLDSNPDAAEAQKVLDNKKEARQKVIDDRKLAAEEKRKATDEARKQAFADKQALKSGTVSGTNVKSNDTTATTQVATKGVEDKKAAIEAARIKSALERQQILDDRKLAAEEKRKAADEARKKSFADKQALKSGTVSDTNVKSNDTTATTQVATKGVEDKKAAIEAARKKSAQERQQILDDRKKASEEKRLKILADREAAKKAKEEKKQ